MGTMLGLPPQGKPINWDKAKGYGIYKSPSSGKACGDKAKGSNVLVN